MANAMKDSTKKEITKSVALGSYFLSGCLAVNVSQAVGTPLYLVNQDWYNAWIAFTKQSFSLLMITLTQFWAPTRVKVSGDESVRGQLLQTTDGDLVCNFPQRLVLMANHQIYTDWLYLWWIAYANGMHGRLYIMVKESLKNIPVIGWGMQLSRFIFLKRNWEADRPRLAAHLRRLARGLDPMWLLLFPEGTNLAPSTRDKSRAWAAKKGIADMRHTLLPRGTGLQFCLRELRGSLRWVYDCTLAYEGVAPGQYAQDIFSLQAQYGQGRPPKCVHMHWRRFHISSIPLEDPLAFEVWLRARWIEKDYLLDFFHKHGRFPVDTGVTRAANGVTRRGAGLIETQVRAKRWYEYLQTFAPVGVLGLILYAVYGALPRKFVEKIKEMSAQRMAALRHMTAGVFDQKFMPRLNEIALANPVIQAIREGKLPQFKMNLPQRERAALKAILPKSVEQSLPENDSAANKGKGQKGLPAPARKSGVASNGLKGPPTMTTVAPNSSKPASRPPARKLPTAKLGPKPAAQSTPAFTRTDSLPVKKQPSRPAAPKTHASGSTSPSTTMAKSAIKKPANRAVPKLGPSKAATTANASQSK